MELPEQPWTRGCGRVREVEARATRPGKEIHIEEHARVFDFLQFFSISHPSKMSMFQRDPRAGAFLGGDRVSGQDIRDQNGVCRRLSYKGIILNAIHCIPFLVVAAMTIANIVKSSLGPLGLDKMLVDNIGVRYKAIYFDLTLMHITSSRKSQSLMMVRRSLV